MALNLPVPEGGIADQPVFMSSDAHELVDKTIVAALVALGLDATAAEINTACDGILAAAAEINTVCDGVLKGTATWDPGSLSAAAQESKDFTVTGAALGDFAIAGAGIDVTDIMVSAVVTATNTVTVTLNNATAGTIDLASSVWKIMVLKNN